MPCIRYRRIRRRPNQRGRGLSDMSPEIYGSSPKYPKGTLFTSATGSSPSTPLFVNTNKSLLAVPTRRSGRPSLSMSAAFSADHDELGNSTGRPSGSMNDLRRTFAVTGEFHNDVSFHIVVTVGARMPAESDAVGHAVAIPVERYIRKFRRREVGRWAGHGCGAGTWVRCCCLCCVATRFPRPFLSINIEIAVSVRIDRFELHARPSEP